MFNKSGFTLIELLVVIAIIGILSAAILTTLQGARDDGQQAALLREASDLQRQILYCQEGVDGADCENLSTGQCNTGLITNRNTLQLPGTNTIKQEIATAYAADCGFRPSGPSGLCTGAAVGFQEARDFCTDNGGRLCSLEELGMTGSGGCSFDNTLNWTATTCRGVNGETGILQARGSTSNYLNESFHTCETDLVLGTGTISCCSENPY